KKRRNVLWRKEPTEERRRRRSPDPRRTRLLRGSKKGAQKMRRGLPSAPQCCLQLPYESEGEQTKWRPLRLQTGTTPSASTRAKVKETRRYAEGDSPNDIHVD